MDLGSLRALALDLTSTAHGVTATVTRPAPDNSPIVTRVKWIDAPLDEQRPFGTSVQRNAPRRVMVLSKADLPTLPNGTIVVAAEAPGGAIKVWRKDNDDAKFIVEEWRAIVTEVLQ